MDRTSTMRLADRWRLFLHNVAATCRNQAATSIHADFAICKHAHWVRSLSRIPHQPPERIVVFAAPMLQLLRVSGSTTERWCASIRRNRGPLAQFGLVCSPTLSSVSASAQTGAKAHRSHSGADNYVQPLLKSTAQWVLWRNIEGCC